MNLPEVTIMVPTYNQAEVIGQAVGSALAQDYPNLEVLVLDDSSTDGTTSELGSFAGDPRLRVSRSIQNLGRLANYRRGLAEARGTWVMMVDGDDRLIDPRFVSTAMAARAAADADDVVAVQAGCRKVYGRQSGLTLPLGPGRPDEVEVLDGEAYLRHMIRTGTFCHIGVIYRRRAALSTGFYSADSLSADAQSVAGLALTGRVILLNRVAGEWRNHGTNASYIGSAPQIVAGIQGFRAVVDQASAAGQLDRRSFRGDINDFEARQAGHYFRQLATSGQVSQAFGLLARAAIGNPAILAHRRLYLPANLAATVALRRAARAASRTQVVAAPPGF